MDKLQEEAGDRNLYPFIDKKEKKKQIKQEEEIVQ
jgi:hypothetical protein